MKTLPFLAAAALLAASAGLCSENGSVYSTSEDFDRFAKKLRKSALEKGREEGEKLPPSKADLDAPAERPVTVRSEIRRGYSAATNAAVATASPAQLDKAWSAIIHRNVQNRTETAGFRLGLSYGIWKSQWRDLSYGTAFERIGSAKLDQTELTILTADMHYAEFKSYSRKLGTSDAQLRELFYKYDPATEDAAWKAAFKSKRFRNTQK